jgi:putative tryptophan/tyrosine transport system substrate-binding protein
MLSRGLARLVVGLFAVLCVSDQGWSQQRAEVAAVLEDSKVYRLALDRFTELAQHGTPAGVTVVPYLLDADLANGPDLMAKIQARHPRLVFAIGTKAAQLANERVRNVPIVYSMVLNPSKQELGGSNICGVALDVSPKEQLAFFQKIKPTVKKVGVIYNPSATDNVIEEAEGFARTAGFELTRRKAQTVKEALVAIKELESEPLDAFLMILDPVIANDASFKILLTFSLKKRIALIVPADPFVKAGAFLSVGADYTKIGDQAWDIAKSILQGDVKPSEVGVRHPEAVIVAINGTIARTLGLEIPRTLKVDIVY